MSAAYDYIVDMAAAVDKRETRLNAVAAEVTAMEAQIKHLTENLEAAQAYAHILGRSVLNDRELITEECERNNWPLPTPAAARAEQPIEHLARAATASTQANPLPPAGDTNPDAMCPMCARSSVRGPRGWVHVNDSTAICDPASGEQRDEVPDVDA